MTKRHLLLTPFLFCGFLAGSLSAAPIFGSFKASGSLEVTTTDIFWVLPAAQRFTFTLGTDDFAVIPDNSVEMIANLNIISQPVGIPIDPEFPFIEFLTEPSLPPLLLGFIEPGVLPGGVPSSCGAAPKGGQFCVPPNPGGSPFLLQNLSATQSIATFRFRGITGANATHKEGESTWTATFTVPFNTRSFQSVLSDLTGPAGKISSSYGGDFNVVITPTTIIPEPGTFALIGMGLIMATVAAKRLKKKS
jgi:hypothetical protein